MHTFFFLSMPQRFSTIRLIWILPWRLCLPPSIYSGGYNLMSSPRSLLAAVVVPSCALPHYSIYYGGLWLLYDVTPSLAGPFFLNVVDVLSFTPFFVFKSFYVFFSICFVLLFWLFPGHSDNFNYISHKTLNRERTRLPIS